MNWRESDLADLFRRRDEAIVQVQPVVRVPRQRMNGWEAAYAREELEPRRLVGEIDWYGFEAIKLRLADQTYLTPDFAVMRKGRLSFVEIKGFLREDALVKFKVAAEAFPFFEFTMYRRKKVSEGGGWERIRHLNGD